jgi:hypothetical protein
MRLAYPKPPDIPKEGEMSERMTVRKFDSLKQRDFQNGAVLDEIRCALKELESLHGEKEQEEGMGLHRCDLPENTVPSVAKRRSKEQPNTNPDDFIPDPSIPCNPRRKP